MSILLTSLTLVVACLPALQPLTRRGWHNIKSFAFSSKKSSVAPSDEPPQVELESGKEDMRCESCALQDLEDKLRSRQENSARTPSTIGGTSLNAISKRPGTPLEWEIRDDESTYALRGAADIFKSPYDHICSCRRRTISLGPSMELLSGTAEHVDKVSGERRRSETDS